MPPVRRVAVVTRERGGLEQPVAELERLAAAHGAEVTGADGASEADVAVVFGGDGTILNALQRLLGTGVPAIGVNFGRVGFLASIAPDELGPGLERVLRGDFEVVDLPTLEVRAGGETRVAVNDVVCTSSSLGRMVELGWSVGGEDLGVLPCDGIICCTPSGSTAYNLSSGGPVLVWGLDAVAVTFVAPHSLHARPLVVPRGREISVWNRTRDVGVTVIADGHPFAELAGGECASIRLGDEWSRLATLPEATFFRRYRDTFR